jgi:hypothetical protein
MILHSKYCSLSIAGFLKRILLKIYFISPFYLYAMNDHFYAQIEIYTLNIIIVIHVCKFKFAQIWNRLQRSFWEPGIKLTLNLAWRFCGNKCPIVYWVKVLGDQNLTYAVICDSSIDVLLQVSNTASCEPRHIIIIQFYHWKDIE